MIDIYTAEQDTKPAKQLETDWGRSRVNEVKLQNLTSEKLNFTKPMVLFKHMPVYLLQNENES